MFTLNSESWALGPKIQRKGLRSCQTFPESGRRKEDMVGLLCQASMDLAGGEAHPGSPLQRHLSALGAAPAGLGRALARLAAELGQHRAHLRVAGRGVYGDAALVTSVGVGAVLEEEAGEGQHQGGG